MLPFQRVRAPSLLMPQPPCLAAWVILPACSPSWQSVMVRDAPSLTLMTSKLLVPVMVLPLRQSLTS